MRLLMFAAALRQGSYNKKLIGAAKRTVEKIGGHEIDFCQFNDFPMPVYDGDIETSTGIPDGTKRLAEKIAAAQKIIISTPEYNGSIPGPFKNCIDWLSRLKPVSITGKHLLLLGASPGANGAVRGLWHSRVPLEALGVFVHPDMFGLGKADEAFDPDGNLKDEKQQQRLEASLKKFLEYRL